MRTSPASAALIAALALAAAASADPSAEVKAQMQGSWEAVAILDGAGRDPPAGITLSVHGDWFTLTEHGNANPAIIAVDPSRSPVTFVLQAMSNPHETGVIEVKDDRLTIAFNKVGGPATTFDPAAGKIVMTFKRSAPASQPAPATRP